MGYFNSVDIVDCDDAPGNDAWWKGMPDNMTADQYLEQRNRNWALANEHATDDDIVNEIHTWLNEAADRNGLDMLHYIGKAENIIELYKARAELKIENEEKEEKQYRKDEKDMLDDMYS